MKTENQAHIDDWVGVYALGALTAPEIRAVEAHLAVCARCRALTSEALQEVAALAQSVEPVAPSPELKRRLFARIDADLAPAQTRPNFFARLFATRARGFAFVTALVVLVLAVAAAFSLRAVNLPAASAAPSAAQAKLYMIPSLPVGMLAVSGVPHLSSDQTYELWLIREGETSRAGVFNVSANGNGWYMIQYDEAIGDFDQAGITIERAGGSDMPNLNRLIFAGGLR